MYTSIVLWSGCVSPNCLMHCQQTASLRYLVPGAAAGQRRAIQTLPVRAAPQHGCVGRHPTNRNEMRVSGCDSYALLFCFIYYLSHCYSIAWDALYIDSPVSVCVCHLSYGRNFHSILMKLYTIDRNPQKYEPFRWGSKSHHSFPYFPPFLPP